ncbi:flagellar assembly protein T N-terminal domain-containing protein [Gynuella sunshinyii]|uniref:Uncharacterized protein n=1 Tax=Gynuella sunshinyii YC6258 TaxID=1445510 RepID=A0A0C5VD28_9GAMM|nr:flagellar assembly protein T N-terminal domain-containing protein [Gynuella sunshinyii]AJQ97235.1 hypothetical Protein YC6258_05205 [Gynuella sunshinyii YC6258]
MKPVILAIIFSLLGSLAAADDLNPDWRNDSAYGSMVEASGQAEIAFGDKDAARMRALRQAIENASMQVNAKVRSTQVLENGSLVVDHLRINSAAKVKSLKVVDEYSRSGTYYVTIRALVSEDQVCATHVANDFRKTVAVTGFPMQYPEQASMGQLGAVDRNFPSQLVNSLNGLPGIQALDASYMMLYPTVANAPTNWNTDNALTKAVETAKQLGVQFVVSGVVRDISMENPNAPDIKPWTGLMKTVGLGTQARMRHMVVDLYVHDGYSGAMVFQSRYEVKGRWDARRNAIVEFGSAAFWRTDFGSQVSKLIAETIVDLQDTIQCQPFMANISKADKYRIYVNQGASSGLRPGDMLAVYRTIDVFDRDQQRMVQLSDTRMVAKIKQVQPHFSIAELPVRVENLNLQPSDVVIAW